MWVFSVVLEPLDWDDATFDHQLAEALLGGCEFLATFLADLSADPRKPMPDPLTCNICDRQIQPWFFEKHTALCIVSHKAESEVQDCHDRLKERRQEAATLLYKLENSSSPIVLNQAPESEGFMIKTQVNESAVNLASPNTVILRSEKHRKLQARLLEMLLDYCDLAIDINTPAIPEDDSGDVFARIQSPDSQGRINQIQAWKSSEMLEDASLYGFFTFLDEAVKAKLSAITRLHNTIHYSEKIRQEIDARVQDLIDATIERGHAAKEPEAYGVVANEAVLSPSRAEHSPELQVADATADIEALPEKSPESKDMDEDYSYDANLRLSQANASNKAISTYADMFSYHEPRSSSPLSHFPPLTQEERSSSRSSLTSAVDLQLPVRTKSTESNLQRLPTSRRNSPQDLEQQISNTRSGRGIYESPRRPSVGSRPQGVSPSRRASRAVSTGRAASLVRDRGPSPGRKVLSSRLGLLERERLSPSSSPPLSAADSASLDNGLREKRISMGPPLSPRLPSIAPAARPAPPSIKDFEIIKPISKGAFGSVYLSKKRTTGDYYAIKVLKKADMIAKNQVTNIKAERAIMMAQTESPFIAKLYFTFQSKEYLYLVMEYLNGGDCAALIKQLGSLPEDWARRYISEVVLGLEYLHSRGIIHRDLKPDNLLISHNGHLKLTDFGLSRVGLVGRQNRARTSSHPEVPELISQSSQISQYHRSGSPSSSRSASFDFAQSGLSTPAIAPISSNDSRSGYFNMKNRKASHTSDQAVLEVDTFSSAVSKLSLDDTRYDSDDGGSTVSGNSSTGFGSSRSHQDTRQRSPNSSSSTAQMPPPAMKLFDPKDGPKRFVGTPDYLAPETIDGTGQDDMVDWWSLGVILFEFLCGFPPFHASSPDAVFENILRRRIDWPPSEDQLELGISEDAKLLMNQLMVINPNDRLGSISGAADIKAHNFFINVFWDRISEEEALFIPTPDHPEDTEYFDARGATDLVLEIQPSTEQETQQGDGALDLGIRSVSSPESIGTPKFANQHRHFLKRSMMPLSIPAHVRDKNQVRRMSESGKDDFGSFTFKNLSMLEKQNLDAIRKLRNEQSNSVSINVPRDSQTYHHMRSPSSSSSNHARRLASPSSSTTSSTPISPTNHMSHARNSLPGSPLSQSASSDLTRHRSRASISALPACQLTDRVQHSMECFNEASPVKANHHSSSLPVPNLSPASPRNRSFTVGSDSRSDVPFSWTSTTRRIPQVFEPDTPSSSSDTEISSGAKALRRVQRRRSDSRRLSSFSVAKEAISFARTNYGLDILICEDNPVSRRVLEAMLAKLKCRVVSVVDGAEAVSAATADVVFDIIFTDIKVPRLSGVEVARLIRSSSGNNANTPIVAMSSYSTSDIRDMTDIFEKRLEKPLTMTAISETIHELLGNWELPSATKKVQEL